MLLAAVVPVCEGSCRKMLAVYFSTKYFNQNILNQLEDIWLCKATVKFGSKFLELL